MPTRLLVVTDAFAARGSGVYVMPRFTADAAVRTPFPVRLRLPDGGERDASAVIEVAHMRGPSGSYAMYKLLGVTPEDVPSGTEIWTTGARDIPTSGRAHIGAGATTWSSTRSPWKDWS